MTRKPDNPDRNVSGGGGPQESERDTRTKQPELSELFDDKAKERFGQIVSGAMRDPKKPRRRK
jgi:hypothetical protein